MVIATLVVDSMRLGANDGPVVLLLGAADKDIVWVEVLRKAVLETYIGVACCRT